MMEFELKNVYNDKPSKTVNLPDELPASIGEQAKQKLDLKVKGNHRGNKQTAQVEVSTSDFSKTKMFIVKQMLKKFTEETINFDEITSESVNEIARYYWEDIEFFDQKKRGTSEEQ